MFPAQTTARITAASRSVAVDISTSDQTLDKAPKGLYINLAVEGTAGTLSVVLWLSDTADVLTVSIPASGVYQLSPKQINTGATGIGSVYALY